MLVNSSKMDNCLSGLKVVYCTASTLIEKVHRLSSKFNNFTSLNRFSLILTSCAVFGLVGSKPSIAAVMYSVTDIGTLGGDYSSAFDINDSGQVVGVAATTGSGDGRAFLWDSINGIRNLTTNVNGIDGSSANKINNNGQVAGSYSLVGLGSNNRAFLWDSVNGLQNLGTLPGDNSSAALGINDKGQIVGRSENISKIQAFLWDNVNGLQNLGTLGEYKNIAAYTINNNEEVVGFASGNNNVRAVLWDSNKVVQNLGSFGTYLSQANSINDEGMVVGVSTVDNSGYRAFLWDNNKGLQNLDSLNEYPNSYASDINNLGQIVGYAFSDFRPLLWENGTITDLNTLIDPNSGWKLQSAVAINNKGQIVGSGLLNNQRLVRAFLLTPLTQTPKSIPEPTSGLGLLGGILGSIYLLKRSASIRYN